MSFKLVPDCGRKHVPRRSLSPADELIDELKKFFGVATKEEAVARTLVVARSAEDFIQESEP